MGTKHPASDVAPLPALEVRATLLALNGTDVPFAVRNARPEEKADLVAEWRILLPAVGSASSRIQLERTLKIRMRLVHTKREVRSLDEQWEKTRIGDPSGPAVSRKYGRGPAPTVSKEWTYERGPDGHRRKVETFGFDSQEMKNPLRNAVLNAGWTWRGVLFKL
ncbi:hypothetical protein [Streptomyces sp. NBC_01217]|uniref:hypothetical protein n=1 Tax=Streptomyces sp. NBC_01217 TaxID=2903779 RepID=UPI002E10FE0F|nr:hypothetical protein OG507_14970 [Streptomyces sp. NBC_01217]